MLRPSSNPLPQKTKNRTDNRDTTKKIIIIILFSCRGAGSEGEADGGDMSSETFPTSVPKIELNSDPNREPGVGGSDLTSDSGACGSDPISVSLLSSFLNTEVSICLHKEHQRKLEEEEETIYA
ncbi:hypothetical protein M5689_005011 [Euphorbia peplus]|nr:hypothetical protein M5689_005011 [Euphorbia peplus]